MLPVENRNSLLPGWGAVSLDATAKRSTLCRYAKKIFPIFIFYASVLALWFAAGCGAPGEPIPRSPLIAAPITDLAAHQQGDAALLTFTLPIKATSGERLATPPAVEILRGSLKPDGSPNLNSFRVVDTIPGELVKNYIVDHVVQFADPIPAEEIKGHSVIDEAYLVRTRASKQKASADSNVVKLQVFAVPERIENIATQVTKTAIELSWPAPTRTTAGESLASPLEYQIYRGELDPASTEAAQKDLTQAKWKEKLALLASSDAPNYPDMSFQFGKTYIYVVRSVTKPDGKTLESRDSVPAIVAARDTFPPAAPQGVVAAVLSGGPSTTGPTESATVHVELSWSISTEPDLAGYRVYRSEQQGTRGESITPELLLTPAARDNSVIPGHRYWYIVTAVDRAGNESAPSAPVAVEITQPLP